MTRKDGIIVFVLTAVTIWLTAGIFMAGGRPVETSSRSPEEVRLARNARHCRAQTLLSAIPLTIGGLAIFVYLIRISKRDARKKKCRVGILLVVACAAAGMWILAERYASALPPADYARWAAGFESADIFLVLHSYAKNGEMVAFVGNDVLPDLEALGQLLEQHRKGEHQLIAVSAGPNVSVKDMAKVRKVCRDSRTGIVPYELPGHARP